MPYGPDAVPVAIASKPDVIAAERFHSMNCYAKYSPGPGLFMLLVGLPGAPKPHAGEDLQAVDALFEWCTRSHTMVCMCGQPLQSGRLCICRLAVPFKSFNCKLQLAGSSFKPSHCMHACACEHTRLIPI